METEDITILNPMILGNNSPSSVKNEGERTFQKILEEHDSPLFHTHSGINNPFIPTEIPTRLPAYQPGQLMAKNVAAIYNLQESQFVIQDKMSDWQKYKDDQLLSNPGGDLYYLEQNRVLNNMPEDQMSFTGRVGKDLSDVLGNVKNFFKDFLFGSSIKYRDKQNQVQTDTKRGFIGSIIDFFKDLGSAFSFGSWRPDKEEEPQGLKGHVGFFFSKMKEAIFGDLLQGTAGSVIHMGEDLIFAGLNLVETIPDATIGNFKKGMEFTSRIFDTTQVLLDYVTDILPAGDAWLRVHSTNLKEMELPVLKNLKMGEHQEEDERWEYVRNTPFRKGIETIGSLMIDILSLDFMGNIGLFSEKRHHGD